MVAKYSRYQENIRSCQTQCVSRQGIIQYRSNAGLEHISNNWYMYNEHSAQNAIIEAANRHYATPVVITVRRKTIAR